MILIVPASSAAFGVPAKATLVVMVSVSHVVTVSPPPMAAPLARVTWSENVTPEALPGSGVVCASALFTLFQLRNGRPTCPSINTTASHALTDKGFLARLQNQLLHIAISPS